MKELTRHSKWRNEKPLIAIAVAIGVMMSQAYGEDAVKLPKPKQKGGMPLLTALKNRASARDFDAKPLSDQTLSDLLWAAFGVNRPESGMRTAPSSFNWQDVTIYVFTAKGVWTFDADEHQLLPVKKGDHRKLAGLQEYVWSAPLSLVYVSDFSKMKQPGMTFDEEYKLIVGAADTGHISQNVYLFGASRGLNVVARGSVDREAFAKAFDLPKHMHVIIGQTIGWPAKEEE